MERKTLESKVANYPYLQGLWVGPLGLMMLLTAILNLEDGPRGFLSIAIILCGLSVCLVVSLGIARYYKANYGEVTPTRSRNVRQGVALFAWIAVLFIGANRFLLWSAESPFCVFAVAFALATLVYYAILVGLRPHHIIIWGALIVAGLLPIWGGLGADRDALALIPVGLALIVSGLLDQRELGRSFGGSSGLNMEGNNAAG